MLKTILDPSSGGTGRRLKIISTRLREITDSKSCIEKEYVSVIVIKARNGKMSSRATTRLEKGPASAISALSLRGCFKFPGLNITGFPQPIWAIKSMRVPMGSRCLSGLRETRPSIFGVGSPRKVAIHACENSCTVTAITRAIMK